MKKVLFFAGLIFILFTISLADYLTSFSAAVENWNASNIESAISLTELSLSSTVNISYAPDLWYFKSRLELMLGKRKDAENSLNMAATVFHPKAVYKLLGALAEASITNFSPVSQVNFVNEIKGFYDGEVFYSPVSVAMRNEEYYVLDEGNRFVEEFGLVQKRLPLGVNSTPTAMIYSPKTDTFFVSFENGNVYEYNPDFSKHFLFASNFSYPIVSFSDNSGRIYVSDEGRDRVVVLENNGDVFKKFDFFKNNRVHIIGYVRESCGIMYVMDFTSKEVRRFDLASGEEMRPIPFPKGDVPSSFEVLGSNVIFVSSHHLTIGGIDFPIADRSAFSSSLMERTLMVCDVESNEIKIYEIQTRSNVFLPLIDRLNFENGKINVFFRILDPLGEWIENAGKTVVDDNGFTKAIIVSKVNVKHKLYIFPKLSSLFHMNKNIENVVILKASSLKGREKDFFSAILLNHVCLYLVEDTDLTELEREMIRLTRGDIISSNEIPDMKSLSRKLKPFEFKATYSTGLPQGVDEVDLMYGGKHIFTDSVYYTLQNVLK